MTVTVTWVNPSADALAADLTVGNILQHAGENGVFTNLQFAALPATNLTTATVFYQGTHSFQLIATNKNGLLSPPSNVASTNLVWKPRSPSSLVIQRLTATNATVTIGLQ